MTYALITLLCVYLLWVHYVAVMRLMQVRDAGHDRRTAWRLVHSSGWDRTVNLFKYLQAAGVPEALASLQRYTATIGYQRATTWEQGSATMQAMVQLLGLTEADLDGLFAYASGVVV